MKAPRILYCNCTHAQVVPPETRKAVLKKLCSAEVGFEAVADLCEMSARRDPAMKDLVGAEGVKIVACYPRAVKWLFAAAGAPLQIERTEVLNMRAEGADQITARVLDPAIQPNVPAGKETAGVPATEAAAA